MALNARKTNDLKATGPPYRSVQCAVVLRIHLQCSQPPHSGSPNHTQQLVSRKQSQLTRWAIPWPRSGTKWKTIVKPKWYNDWCWAIAQLRNPIPVKNTLAQKWNPLSPILESLLVLGALQLYTSYSTQQPTARAKLHGTLYKIPLSRRYWDVGWRKLKIRWRFVQVEKTKGPPAVEKWKYVQSKKRKA